MAPLCFRLSQLLRPERGQVMVEYGLILGLIVMVGFVGVLALGDGVGALYNVIEAVVNHLTVS